MTNNIDKQSFGEAGCVLVATSTVPVGEYCAVQCVTAATLTVTSTQAPIATGVNGVELPVGFTLFTPIVSKTGSTPSVSGTAIFYKAL